MEKGFLENIEFTNINSLNIHDASILILERMKFLDKNSQDYKFKEYDNQVVVETKDYFYKIYIDYGPVGRYLLEIRKKLADIYRSYGIHWELINSYNDGRFITVEQREKLKVCAYSDLTCGELLRNWKKSVVLLNKSLNFEDILKQIKDKSNVPEFNSAKDLLLLRHSLVKVNDYAYAPNGNIVLIDDADFFLSIIDENGEQISKKNFDLEVITTCGKMNFSSNKEFWEKNVQGNFDISKSFFIFDKRDDCAFQDKFISNNKDTDEKKLRLFVTGKPSNTKYQNEYIEEYSKRRNIMLNNSKKHCLSSNK